jgi:hypothetical protein
MATDEIKTVNRFSWDGDSYVVRCPHCDQVIGIEGRVPHDILGEQYQHRTCGGWLQVSNGAREVRTVVSEG